MQKENCVLLTAHREGSITMMLITVLYMYPNIYAQYIGESYIQVMNKKEITPTETFQGCSTHVSMELH